MVLVLPELRRVEEILLRQFVRAREVRSNRGGNLRGCVGKHVHLRGRGRVGLHHVLASDRGVHQDGGGVSAQVAIVAFPAPVQAERGHFRERPLVAMHQVVDHADGGRGKGVGQVFLPGKQPVVALEIEQGGRERVGAARKLAPQSGRQSGPQSEGHDAVHGTRRRGDRPDPWGLGIHVLRPGRMRVDCNDLEFIRWKGSRRHQRRMGVLEGAAAVRREAEEDAEPLHFRAT